MSSPPLLTLLQALPLIGAVLALALRRHLDPIHVGRVFAASELAVAVVLYTRFNASSPEFQFVERLPLLGYHAGADGVTVLFVLLAALIMCLLSLYGLVRGLAGAARLTACILAAQAAIMAMLVNLNLLWFAAASAVELLLVAYLLGRWSTSSEENRALAMTRFVQFQSFGWLLFVGGTLLLAWNAADRSGHWSFDLVELAAQPLPGTFQSAAFFLLFYGLAVRTPIFPLHGWLPNVAHRGMVAVVPVLLLGIKTGIYGMLRFVLPLTPQAVVAWQPYVIGVAMLGVFYSAALALAQHNLRRLLAFAVVSHTGLIVIGLFTLHPDGLLGSMLLAVNFGLAVTVMLFMVGFVFRRTRTTDLERLGGLFDRVPFLALSFLAGGLSIVGMPGTPGFDAAHLVLEAAIETFGALPTVATALGNVAAAGFLLWAFQRAFLAPRPTGTSTGNGAAIERTTPMEYAVGGIAVTVLLAAGFFPEPWLHLMEASTRALAARFVPALP